MAALYNLARVRTSTTGTGTITLGNALILSFAQAGVQNGDTVTYAIKDRNDQYEIGRGVYTAASLTLTRSVLKSTNSNNALDLSGNAEVYITAAAEDINSPTLTAGAVGSPSLSFIADSNTGFWSPGADAISASTGGTERVRIDSSGRLLVGTTAAVAVGALSTQAIQIAATGNAASQSISRWADDANGTRFAFGKSRSTTIGSGFTIVQNGDTIGSFEFSADNGVDVSSRAADIVAAVDAVPSSTSMPGRLLLRTTAAGAVAPTERMRITSAGNVGIGGTPTAAQSLLVTKNITGSTTAAGIRSDGVIQSDVTTAAQIFRAVSNTAATSFTVGDITLYSGTQGTIGAGSAVTNQYGFRCESGLTGATNNYAFRADIAAATGRWNFYANGTARNWFGGNVGLAASGYINWNTTDGSSGYGIRDNSTVIEAKSSGGDWTPILGTTVSAKTSTPYSVIAADARKTFTNEGTTVKIVFNLPLAAASLGPFTFIVQDSDGIQVVAATGDTIRIAGSVSAAAGNIDSTTIGSTVTLVAINDTEWIATSSLGTWVVT